LAEEIVNLTKKSHNILQLQMTISFKIKHIKIASYNKLFNANHALLVCARHNSIEISRYPAFSCL